MMSPPIFATCSADTSVQSLLSDPKTGRLNLYPFGEAPQLDKKPYAVWQIVGGAPELYLGQRPDVDCFTVQIDVYAQTVSDTREIAGALMAAIEVVANVVRFNGEYRDADTRAYRYSFTVDWFTAR